MRINRPNIDGTLKRFNIKLHLKLLFAYFLLVLLIAILTSHNFLLGLFISFVGYLSIFIVPVCFNSSSVLSNHKFVCTNILNAFKCLVFVVFRFYQIINKKSEIPID